MANEKPNNDMDRTQVFKIDPKVKNKKTKKSKKAMDPKKRRKILITVLLIILILAGVAFGLLYGIAREAKLGIEELAIKYENSEVRDIEGNTIAVLSGVENRESISISDMAEYLPVAFVSIEDERFYEHSGIDIKRTLAATLKYATGNASYGGSTITQQLVKNLTSEKDRTWKRKVTEMARAYYIEKELSKDEILELYLNLIFMGGNSYGVQIASNYYFSKSASDLSLAECAFLAGINNTPNSYNPFVDDEQTKTGHLELIKARTKTVLNKMKELGKIKSQEEYDQAVAEVDAGLVFNKGTASESIYSYHTEAALTQIINEIMEENDWSYEAAKLHLFNGGYVIYTTQNTNIQNIMQEEAEKSKYATKSSDGQNAQSGMTLIDHSNGYVLGVLGGLGKKTTSFGLNRGTQILKQTGSSMKPLAVVAPGVEKGIITAGTVYDDTPFSYGGTRFKNYNYYKGLLTVRYAIESSQNIPMLKGMLALGAENSVEFLKTLGIDNLTDSDKSLSLALGGLTYGTSPLKMAAAYATIANDGVYITPTFYTKVEDSNGNVIREVKQEKRTVMSKAAAYIVKSILTQPVKSGTATNCAISGMSVAAKTGTTNDDFDRWLCGFTPYYAAAAWFGYDQNSTITGWSRNPAGIIWASVMQQSHSGLTGKSFEKPDGVVTATICKCSGKLATEECKNDPRGDMTYTEYFVSGTVPKDYCDCHVKVDICEDTNLLANEHCPHKVSKVFITRPDWETDTAWKGAKDAEYMLTIKDGCTTHTEAADTEKPELKLKGNNNITVYLNSSYTDAGATAWDNKDGDLTSKIEIKNSVDTSKAGSYNVTYTVKDSSGNISTITRTVNVKDNSSTINNTVEPPANNTVNTTNTTNVTEE